MSHVPEYLQKVLLLAAKECIYPSIGERSEWSLGQGPENYHRSFRLPAEWHEVVVKQATSKDLEIIPTGYIGASSRATSEYDWAKLVWFQGGNPDFSDPVCWVFEVRSRVRDYFDSSRYSQESFGETFGAAIARAAKLQQKLGLGKAPQGPPDLVIRSYWGIDPEPEDTRDGNYGPTVEVYDLRSLDHELLAATV